MAAAPPAFAATNPRSLSAVVSLAHFSLSSPSLLPGPILRLGDSPAVRVRAVASSSPKPKGELRGIMKPRRVSPEMEAVVGVPEIPRTQVLKRIWAHIKENNLQDPNDKKVIVCDEKLKKIFGGKERVGFLEIAGLISPHFL
ncbi:hypothetical protein MLD38_026695 [Melastoma candidum]|uniref:Uncharacterized protein n=1 Tax=Melastoma candidum TaxID=119954 RepID=A0ACB9P0R2_9MYRT|nr:hypothetical protein MLD38_026695 [Melastoma candidum]